MAKQVIQVDGIVEECLPNATFRVRIDDPNYPSDHTLLCHLSGKMRIHYIRIIPGDQVTIELTPYDLTKGRITYRHKKGAKRPAHLEKKTEVVTEEAKPEENTENSSEENSN